MIHDFYSKCYLYPFWSLFPRDREKAWILMKNQKKKPRKLQEIVFPVFIFAVRLHTEGRAFIILRRFPNFDAYFLVVSKI